LKLSDIFSIIDRSAVLKLIQNHIEVPSLLFGESRTRGGHLVLFSKIDTDSWLVIFPWGDMD
jgi:hypothetical protein